MPYLIKGANVFTPKFLGKKDVLILEEKIAAIEDDLSQVSLPNLEVIEAKGLNLTPGFMDQHVHITGGGGEGALKPDVQNFNYQNSFSAELLLLSVF